MTYAEICSAAELRDLLGLPSGRAVTKERTRLHAVDREWLAVRGRRPILALLVDVEQIFFHCPKSFLRSRLWDPQSWRPDALPSHAALVKRVQETPETLEELEQHYAVANYSRLLY